MVILLGGVYEWVVLSDYGCKDRPHGRYFAFWTGPPIEEALFRKGVTPLSRMMRRLRNLICQLCLISVLLLDPIACMLLPEEMATLTVLFICKSFVLVVPLGYVLSLMLEATRQPQKNNQAASNSSSGKSQQNNSARS